MKNTFKIILIVLFIYGFIHKAESQEKTENFFDKYMYTGVAVGPETGISAFLPKIGYYNFKESGNFETYFGAEASFWVIQWPMLSADILYGIKKNLFTFDTSLGVLWLPKATYVKTTPHRTHITLNPKIGIRLGKVWIKAGPGVFLYKNYIREESAPILNLVRIGSVHYNFEILYKF